MKKILLSILLLSNAFLLTAQTGKTKTKVKAKAKPKPVAIISKPVAPECVEFMQIVNVVNANKLETLKTTPYTSKYYGSKTLFGSTINIPGEDSFIDEGDYGITYHCFIKNYGSDETAAEADFDELVKKFSGCLVKPEISKASGMDTYIFYKKCRIEIHTFQSGNVNAWVASVTIERY